MILLHYLTRLFLYLFTYLVSSKDGKKKGCLALSRRPLLPSLLQVPNWSESSSTYLPIGSYHVGALLLLEEPAWEGSRVVILASVRGCIHSLTHSLTHHYVRYMYPVILGMYLCKEDGRGNCACAAACAAATAVVRSGQARPGQLRYL